jgi:hypothetical protein
MNFVKYVKYTGLAIIAIFTTFIAFISAAVFIEATTWNEAGKWIIKAAELAGVGLLLSIVMSIIGTVVAKDAKKK